MELFVNISGEKKKLHRNKTRISNIRKEY